MFAGSAGRCSLAHLWRKAKEFNMQLLLSCPLLCLLQSSHTALLFYKAIQDKDGCFDNTHQPILNISLKAKIFKVKLLVFRQVGLVDFWAWGEIIFWLELVFIFTLCLFSLYGSFSFLLEKKSMIMPPPTLPKSFLRCKSHPFTPAWNPEISDMKNILNMIIHPACLSGATQIKWKNHKMKVFNC